MRQPQDLQHAPELDAAIRVEMSEEPQRRSTIDRDAIRAGSRKLIAERIASAAPRLGRFDESGTFKLDPALAPRLQALAGTVDASIDRLDALILAHPAAGHANRRYSPEAHARSDEAFVVFAGVRRKLDKRLGSNDVDRAIKEGCSVGDIVRGDSPLDVRDRIVRMIGTLEHPKYAPRYAARGLELPAMLFPLKKKLAILEEALERGLGTTLTRGESTERIEKELVFLDIAFERLVSFLEDHGAEEIARGIEELVPRKVRKAGEAGEEEEPELPGVEEPRSDDGSNPVDEDA